MRVRIGVQRAGVAIVLACMSGLFATRSVSADDGDATRRAMAKMFESIRVLLPASVDSARFGDATRAPELRAALAGVSEAARAVASHTKAPHSGVRFLGRSLDREARRALQLYDSGQTDRSRFAVLQIAEYCAACHSRLPSDDAALSRNLLDSPAFARLETAERGRLEIATRQFEAGLASLEKVILDPETPTATLLDPITDHLVVSIRVKRDFARPRALLQKLVARKDLWSFVRLDLERWLASLDEVEERATSSASLEDAVAIVRESEALRRFPTDRQSLVHSVAASSILHRFIEAHPEQSPRVAKAYYLLGVAEMATGPNYWLALDRFYLETSIRMAPGAPTAIDAYALLEEETILAFTGSGGVNLPDDVRAWLDELRQLIFAAQPDLFRIDEAADEPEDVT